MAASDRDVVAFTEAYIRELIEKNMRYDCTQPGIYEQFTRNVATEMSRARHVDVTAADVDRAIAATVTLRTHPMLLRTRYHQQEPVQRTSTFGDVLLDGWRTLTAGGGAPKATQHRDDNVGADSSMLQKEALRVLEIVNKAIPEALADGSYLRFSNPAENDFYVCVPAVYDMCASRIVERAIEVEYSRNRVTLERDRPVFESVMRYNMTDAAARSSKRNVLAMLFFRFPVTPSAYAARYSQ
jgi:hypothetical protein